VRAGAPERKVGPGFGPDDPTWVRLSVGRTQAAEPRWLIPMLCKAAGVTKRDLGAIRIGDDETMVEMSGHAAQALLGALGPDGRLEKNVYAALAVGAPRPMTHAAKPKPKYPGKAKSRAAGDKPPARKKREWTPHD
jgi:ATP-dependent RNA helicase DeaD